MKQHIITVAAGMFLFTSVVSAADAPDQGARPSERSGSRMDLAGIEKAVGKAGDLKDDVYKVSMPRKDLSVTIKGVKVKPGLALGSWVAFKEVGNEAIMDGDLVLTEEEVGPVFQK